MFHTNLVLVAQIVKAFGVNGEARIVSCSEFVGRLTELKEVFLLVPKGQKIPAVVEAVRKDIIKLECLKSREDAQKFAGSFIAIDKKFLKNLPEGRYYYYQIIGLQVFDLRGSYLGKIKEIIPTGSNDIYVVRKDLEEILIPALKAVVKKVDLKLGRMEVVLQE